MSQWDYKIDQPTPGPFPFPNLRNGPGIEVELLFNIVLENTIVTSVKHCCSCYWASTLKAFVVPCLWSLL